MKVRVALTLDVDVEAWALTYGIEEHEVRADVRLHVANVVRYVLEAEGLLVGGAR